MNFFTKLRHLSYPELKTLAGFTGGAALLVLVALGFSGNAPGFGNMRLAINNTAQGAAVYTSIGSQTYTVPDGVIQIHVDMWGGGGIAFSGGNIGSCEGYYVNSQGNGPGGGGGYTGADIPVTPGQVFTLVVGAADGGGAGSGNGGGYSGIFSGSASQANALLIAGGGGGSGANIHIYAANGTCNFPNAGAGAPGGLGGGTNGGNVNGGPTGGTQTAGGTGTSPGGPLTGGTGTTWAGGGGAGYWGGGGASGSGQYGGPGGGGGSGYCKSTLLNCSVIGASTQGMAANSPSKHENAGNSNNPGEIIITETSAPPPTLTIAGNGTNPATITLGQSVTVAATFTAGAGDTLGKSAINDNNNNLWCGTGCTPDSSMWTATPLGSKSYTFTPVATGSYIFYPAATTTGYPAWNNYGQSLTVTVAAAPINCANGTGLEGACTACNSGFVLSGGYCVASTCPLANQTNPPACTCASGYAQQADGSCLLLTAGNCPLAHQSNPPACACDSGYTQQADNSCVLTPGPTVDFTAAPTQVVESGSPQTSTITLSRGAASASSLVVGFSRTGTAGISTDYMLSAGTCTGVSSVLATIPANAASCTIILTAAASGIASGSSKVATLTPLDIGTYNVGTAASVIIKGPTCAATYTCTDGTTVHSSCPAPAGTDLACSAGYQCISGNPACQLIPLPSISGFSTNPTRLHADTATSVVFSWSGVNLGSCTVLGPGVNVTTAGNSTTKTISISSTAVYTLTCGSAPPKTATILLVPSFIEI